MCAARRQRLTREAIGGTEVGFPENIIRNITVVALVLLLGFAMAPAREKRPVVASSAIDARATRQVHEAPPAQLAGEAAEGNVVDMTY